jgi:hypothetical protein
VKIAPDWNGIRISNQVVSTYQSSRLCGPIKCNYSMSHDLTPIFQNEIDAEILDYSLETPSSEGWVKVSKWTKYHNHTVVFAHFAEGGQLKNTHYDGQKKEGSAKLRPS